MNTSMQMGDRVRTPEGPGTVLTVLDAHHPTRAANPSGWTYADGTIVTPDATLYVVTLRDSHHAVYTEDELARAGEPLQLTLEDTPCHATTSASTAVQSKRSKSRRPPP